MIRTRSTKVNTTKWYDSSSLFLNRVAPSLVHDYTNQRYYNSADGETAFPFTATRTTNATQFDAQGRLVWAPANLCPQSENFASASWAVSGGGGSKTTGVADPNGGTAACTFTASGVNAVLQLSTGSGVVGQNYTVTMWLRRRTGSGTVQIRAIESVNTTVAVTTSWQKFSVAATATTTTFRVGINISTTGDEVDIAFPQAEVTGPNSPIPYISTGSSASNFYGARFDYDPLTLTPRGVLIEESRTNLQPISQGATSDWTANFGTLTSTGATIAGNAAYTFTVTSTGSAQFVFVTTNAGTLSASTSYTSSIRVKKGNHPRVQFTVSNNTFLPAGTDAYVNYNFDTDTLTVAGSASPKGTRTLCSDGSVILTLTYTTGSAPTAGASGIICLVDTDGAVRLAGTGTNGATVHVLGVQLEQGAFVTSYIPTYGVTATRAADTLTVSTGAWLTQSLGTFFVEYIETKLPSGVFPTLVQIDDGTASNVMQVFSGTNSTGSTGGARIDTGGAGQVNGTTSNHINFGTPTRTAMAYTANNTRLVTQGGTVVPDTTCTMGTGINTLRISKNTGSVVNARWIKSIRYYGDVSASDAQLQALTA